MNAYTFITQSEALTIAAGSMNEAEQLVLEQHPDITLADLKAAQRIYTHGAKQARRVALSTAAAEPNGEPVQAAETG